MGGVSMIRIFTLSDSRWDDETLEAGVTAGALTLEYGADADLRLLAAPTCVDYPDEPARHSWSVTEFARPKSTAVGRLVAVEKSSDPALAETVTSVQLTSIDLSAPMHDAIEAEVPAGYFDTMRARLARAPVLVDTEIDDEPIL